MRRRLTALLIALVAVLGLSVSAPQPAAAAGPIGTGVQIACNINPVMGIGRLLDVKIGGLGTKEVCAKLGHAADKAAKEAWKAVQDSLLGDVIVACEDAAKWMIKKVFTVALLGPSMDLEATGLFGEKAQLAGMLVWLGLVIAAIGMMWQLGKMAITGQIKHAGRSMLGWVENLILTAVGVGIFALLLSFGDALTNGLVDATFKEPGDAYGRIVAVMIPKGIGNPLMMLGLVQVLLIVGFIQLVLVFLRQSAIPIICLLLPVAGAGRAGGDATRQWAPKLITSGLVIVAYKPILAVIICIGFNGFGHATTLSEWLRGCATLLLGVLAPGPLTKIFAPFGAAVGGGLSMGGAGGALTAAAGYFGGKEGAGGDGGDGAGPTSAVEHARYVEQQRGGNDGSAGPGGGAGGDAQAQAARNEGARIPAQATAGGEAAGAGGAAGSAGAAGGSGAAAAGPAGAAVAVGIQVLDGVNDAIQGASGEMGGGNRQ
ncbi:hypothetical protein [Streptomyces sp. LN699]|uniref:hypothetical protein n=1 Tax=Streptomyces sp. LN699 TaxID=3112981 RepID=UPI003723F870